MGGGLPANIGGYQANMEGEITAIIGGILANLGLPVNIGLQTRDFVFL